MARFQRLAILRLVQFVAGFVSEKKGGNAEVSRKIAEFTALLNFQNKRYGRSLNYLPSVGIYLPTYLYLGR